MKKLSIMLALWLGLAGLWSQAHAQTQSPGFVRESIEMAFDRNRGRFYAIYSRAVREHPTLKGKVTLRFTVTPQGVFSNCRVVHSELDSPGLEDKFCETVERMSIAPFSGAPQVIDKFLEFFPAG